MAKFPNKPDTIEVKQDFARVYFKGFLYHEHIEVNLGDVGGDIATTYIIKPVPAGPYVKIGCYVD